MPRRSMTGWFNPLMLLRTGIRVVLSSIFGEFVDRREAMAASNAVAPQPFDKTFDYSRFKEEFWFDFVADTGDGWDSTFATATMLTRAQLPLRDGASLPRGQLLVMGGDQVYPTASREEYRDRLLAPFEAAFRNSQAETPWPETPPDLYAIPGNHDWYDGLNAFTGLFCRRRIASEGAIGTSRPGRMIAGWQTRQTRSYFAIQLPHNWWVWGTDAQLKGYIDQPQIDFFTHAAHHWMGEKARIILCVGQPVWACAGKQADEGFDSFTYLAGLAARAGKGHEMKVAVSGDQHHYSRFSCEGRHYVTCGGGGAFLHPTHQLRSTEVTQTWQADGVEQKKKWRFELASHDQGKAIYPTAGRSRFLSLGNLFFAFRNPGLTATFFALYLLFNWLLDFVSRAEDSGSLAAMLAKAKPGEALRAYLGLLLDSPFTFLLLTTAVVGYVLFSDPKVGRWWRILIGLVHAVLQVSAAVLTTWYVLVTAPNWWPGLAGFVGGTHAGAGAWLGREMEAGALIAGTAAAAFVSATIFGLYLLISINLLKTHWTHSFSSLRIAGYKSFLRMKIDSKGALTLHAIGLDRTPRTRRQAKPRADVQPHIVETVRIS